VFLVHVVVYWTGIALIAGYLGSSSVARVVLVVVLGLFPPTYGLLPTIWKDVGVMGSWSLAIGLLLQRERSPRSVMLVVAALLFLLYGGAVRHNTWPALLPLLYIVAARPVEGAPSPRRGRGALRRIALTLMLFALLFGLAKAINGLGARHVIMWAQVPLWDLAAISVLTGRDEVPDYVLIDSQRNHGSERLAHFFDSRTVAPLFWRDGGFARFELLPEEARRLLRDWLLAIRAHPREYAVHRLRTTSRLLGLSGRVGGEYHRDHSGSEPEGCQRPRGLLRSRLSALPTRFDDGPMTARFTRVLDRLSETGLYRPWLYVLLSAAIFVASFRIQGRPAFLARCIALSGLLYVAPLPLVAPSVEFRYTVWLFEATVVAVALMVVAVREGRHRAATSPRIGASMADMG